MPRKIMYVGYLKNENEKNKETAQKQKLSATECSTISLTTDTIYLRAMERPENNDSQVGKSSLSSQD